MARFEDEDDDFEEYLAILKDVGSRFLDRWERSDPLSIGITICLALQDAGLLALDPETNKAIRISGFIDPEGKVN